MIRRLTKLLPFPVLNRFLRASKHEFGLTRLILIAVSPLICAWRLLDRVPITHKSRIGKILKAGHGDILLFADPFWNNNFSVAAEEAKHNGAIIIAIIYDMVPVSHPKMAAPRTLKNFESTLSDLHSCADGFLCISDYTKSALIDYFKRQPYSQDLHAKRFEFFHLGAELDAVDIKGRTRGEVKRPFQNIMPIYLTVGTIEPRKNHIYLLKSFDMLWREGSSASLVIIGRIGWLCDDIVAAIRSHSMFGTRLFFIDDANDSELEYCYSHSKALLFPAIVEGFGLPLIEAQKKGLPVFASDIPVFHEVAGNSAAYFDNMDPGSLAFMLLEYERTGIFSADGPHGFTWPTWAESTSQMLTRLLQMKQDIQSNSTSHIISSQKMHDTLQSF